MKNHRVYRQRLTVAVTSGLSALFVVTCLAGMTFPAIAEGIGSDLLEQVEPLNKTGINPAKPGKNVPIIEYLMIGRDNLEFHDDAPLESGLMPASGDDPDNLIMPGQKPALPGIE